MGNTKREIILILQYLDENTTSTLRFQSIINELINKKDFNVKVLIINYPIVNKNLLGLELSQKDSYQQTGFELINYYPEFSQLQKLSFFFLNNNFGLLWKISQMLRILFCGKDNFHTSKIDNLIRLLNVNMKQGFVMAFGGPFSLFSTANNLSKKINFKLILDYRDPWTCGYTPLGGINFLHQIRNCREKKHELALISNANLITTVSSSLKNFLPENIQTKIKVIPNGSNFNDIEITKETNIKNFNIVYAGTVYNEQLLDLTFFESFKIFLKDKDTNTISLQFIGSDNNPLLKNILKKYDLLHLSIISKRVVRKNLLKILNDSSVFLHLKYGDKKNIITSKQSDYLTFRRPILLPKDDLGDLSESINKNQAGFVCNSVDENVKILNFLFQKFQKKENLFINQSEEFINSLKRETISKEFVNFLLKI